MGVIKGDIRSLDYSSFAVQPFTDSSVWIGFWGLGSRAKQP